ncbi:uncharacterized protein LOC108204391 isoform X3 [Daucus carota subsp. sativus]|uniref:uncharacterized protein LOC108204391 isoform X3 n=1 Tax=Daucus carota subsp. sativus TaxID=79200 RepID=UPI0030836FE7
MGRPNRAKDKDGDPLRTQNAKRLDCQKSISDRKKANLDRLKVSMQRAKALGGEIPILNSLSLQIPTSASQFRIYRRTPSLSESQRSIVAGALSVFPQSPPVPWVGFSAYFLFEFACGYALFEAHGVNELHLSNYHHPLSLHFKSYEEYINRPHQTFTLKAFHPFSSTAEALVQMNAISNSTLSQQLRNFLENDLPNPFDVQTRYYVSTMDIDLGHNISNALRMSVECGRQNNDLMRSLRMNIEKFIDGLMVYVLYSPKDVEKAQQNLARLYSRQMCTSTYAQSSTRISSSSVQRGLVVPYRFEGVFIAKGKEDFICTRNLVPGEALYGEELIFVQNEGGTEVEYRVWNPLMSNLANAIMCGVTNIWVKPGSRILYLGDDVCQITLSHLSDLVGLDGLVYVVGLSDVAVKMAEKRPNVITVFQKPSCIGKYRMVVGMVDVIYADIHSDEVHTITSNIIYYLRAGGHYLVYTRASNIYSTTRGKDPFAYHHRQKEFTPIEAVMLEPIDREYAMAVGGFRMPEE